MNEIVRTLSDAVLRYLVVGSMAALALVLVALAFLKVARIRTPVYRHMVWLYCLMGIVGLPLIWLYGPKLTLAILPARAETHAALASPLAGPEMREPFSDARLTPPRPLTTAGHERIVSWKTAVAAVWFLGFFIMLTRLAVGWLRLRRICRAAIPLQASEYPAGLASPNLRLRLTSQLPGPVCFGVFRPIVLLPEDIYRGGSRENLRMVLTHELAHVERRDCWANLFQRFLEAMYFFHPLVWLASRQLTQERERICDNHVLAEGISADDYTTLLSHLGTQAVHTPYLQTVALFEGQLLTRIRSLLDPARNRQTKLPWRVAAICTVAVLAGFLLFGSIRLAAQTSDRAAGASPGSPLSSSASVEQKPAQSPSQPAADSPNPAPPRYAARTFNSNVAFGVFIRETPESEWKEIGSTPSAAPLEIPACYIWWVQPSGPVKDWDLLAREINQEKVPALRLKVATDSDVKHLAGLTDLQWLDLRGTQVGDAGLADLKGLTGLRVLYLHNTQITDGGLAHLKALTGLRQLQLDRTKITGAGLAHLKGLTGLRVLWLQNTKASDLGMEHLTGLTQLRDLRLSNTQITGAGLEHFEGLTGLRNLDLGGTQVTDLGLEHLRGLTDLHTLGLDGTQVTDGGLAHLKGLTRLQELWLAGTKVTDLGLGHLQGLTGLWLLDLSDTKITDSGLANVKGLAGLKLLYLSGTQVTDSGVQQLKQSLPNLTVTRGQAQSTTQSVDKPAVASEKPTPPRYAARTFNSKVAFKVVVMETHSFMSPRREPGSTPSIAPLDIPACYIWWVKPSAPVKDWDLLAREIGENRVPGLELDAATDSEVSHLAGLTDLQWLGLSGTQVGDAGLADLKGLKALQFLYLDDTRVTNLGLEHLKGLTTLQRLDLSNTKTTDAGLENLQGLTRLRILWLDGTQITDAGLEHLKGLTTLEVLILSDTKITDAGLAALKGLKALQDLDLGDTRVTDLGLEHLKGLTTLQRLDLSSTKTTDVGMTHLKGLTGLLSLNLEYTQVTDAGLAYIEGMTRLQWLNLSSTKLTDAGLEHLKGLTGLTQLYLVKTQVTDAGVQKLERSLPNLTVVRDQTQPTTQSTDKSAQ